MQKVRYQKILYLVTGIKFQMSKTLSLTVLFTLSVNLNILAFEKVFESSTKLIVFQFTHNYPQKTILQDFRYLLWI